ncbi:MAG: Bax inhibitor-1/YccA family protein [Clostridiales bacterium]|nr:Bax inhibitor-1/YccA family protein [Clostridiales bacterium]
MFYEERECEVVETEGFGKFLVRVFAWMFLGVFMSASAAFIVTNLLPIRAVVGVVIGSVVVQIIVAIVIAVVKLNKISYGKLLGLFSIYSISTGAALTLIQYKYSLANIAISFLAAAVFFGVMAFYGATTKKDLTSVGAVSVVTLIAIIAVTVINIFLKFGWLNLVLSYISVAVFLALTAYDVKRLKDIYIDNNGVVSDKIVLWGALDLYLEFVNLFIRILEILGKSEK